MEEQVNVLVKKKLREIKALTEKLDINEETEELLKLLWLIEHEACQVREYILKSVTFEEQ